MATVPDHHHQSTDLYQHAHPNASVAPDQAGYSKTLPFGIGKADSDHDDFSFDVDEQPRLINPLPRRPRKSSEVAFDGLKLANCADFLGGILSVQHPALQALRNSINYGDIVSAIQLVAEALTVRFPKVNAISYATYLRQVLSGSGNAVKRQDLIFEATDSHNDGISYLVVGRFASGGFGDAYEVVDPISGEPYALKVIRDIKIIDKLDSEGCWDPVDLTQKSDARFLQAWEELSAVSKLGRGKKGDHVTHFPELVEHGVVKNETDNSSTPFLVMTLMNGPSLNKLQNLDTRDLADIAVQLCHMQKILDAQGIVHGDIKPANLILDENGVVKLVDFGLALDRNGPNFSKLQDFRSSTVSGTVHFMAPEQVNGGGVNKTTDLNCMMQMILYMLLKRTPIAGGKTILEIVQNHGAVAINPATLQIIERKLSSVPGVSVNQVGALADMLSNVLSDKIEDRPTPEMLTKAWLPFSRNGKNYIPNNEKNSGDSVHTAFEDIVAGNYVVTLNGVSTSNLSYVSDGQQIQLVTRSVRDRLLDWARKNPALATVTTLTGGALILLTGIFAKSFNHSNSGENRPIIANVASNEGKPPVEFKSDTEQDSEVSPNSIAPLPEKRIFASIKEVHDPNDQSVKKQLHLFEDVSAIQLLLNESEYSSVEGEDGSITYSTSIPASKYVESIAALFGNGKKTLPSALFPPNGTQNSQHNIDIVVKVASNGSTVVTFTFPETQKNPGVKTINTIKIDDHGNVTKEINSLPPYDNFGSVFEKK